jgi:hypothetical protein
VSRLKAEMRRNKKLEVDNERAILELDTIHNTYKYKMARLGKVRSCDANSQLCLSSQIPMLAFSRQGTAPRRQQTIYSHEMADSNDHQHRSPLQLCA